MIWKHSKKIHNWEFALGHWPNNISNLGICSTTIANKTNEITKTILKIARTKWKEKEKWMKIQREKRNGSNRNIARLGWLCVCVLYSHLILYVCNTTWKLQIAIAYSIYKYMQWHVMYIYIERMKPNLQLTQCFNWTLWMQHCSQCLPHLTLFMYFIRCISQSSFRERTKL